MEWNSGFRDGDPSSTTSAGSGTLGPPRDRRSCELRLPPRDERIPSEFWRQQERQLSVGAEGSHTDGENEQAGRWQQAAADDTDGPVERIDQAVAGSGWGSGGASSDVDKDSTRQSSSGWGAAWREAVANGTAVASTTSTFNGGWGAPYRGGNDVCGWGTTCSKANNGVNDTATAAAASDSNVTMAEDDDVMPVDSDVHAPKTRSARQLGKLFQFNAKISEMPCQCLEAWISRNKVGRGVPKMSCYSTWNIDPATPHQPKWVSIFTSPVNGECFISGQWKGSPTGYEKIEMAAIDGSKVLIPSYCKCFLLFFFQLRKRNLFSYWRCHLLISICRYFPHFPSSMTHTYICM